MNVDFNTPHRSLSERGLSSVMELCSPISFTDPLESFASDNEFDSGNANDITSGVHHSNHSFSLYSSADRNHPLHDDSDRYIAPRANHDVSLSNYLLTSKENCNPIQMFSPRVENSLSATPSRSVPRSKWQTISSASPSQVHFFTASRGRSTRHPFLTHPTRSSVTGRSTSPLLLTSNHELALNQSDDANGMREEIVMQEEEEEEEEEAISLSSPLLAVRECEPVHIPNSPNNLQTLSEEETQEQPSEPSRVPSPEVEMEKYSCTNDNDNDNMNGMKTTSHSIREVDKSDNELQYLEERRKRQKSEAAVTSASIVDKTTEGDVDNINMKNQREASPLPHPPGEFSSFATPPPVFFSSPQPLSSHSPIPHNSSMRKEGSLFSSFKVEKRLFSPTSSHPRHTPSQHFTCTNANRLSSVFRKLHLDTDHTNTNHINARLGRSMSNNNNGHPNMVAAGPSSLSQPRMSALYDDGNSPENSYSTSQPSPRQKISMLHRPSSSSAHGEGHCGNCMSHSLPQEEPGFLSMTDIEPYTSKLARTLFSESPQVSVLGLHHHAPDHTFSSSCSNSNYYNNNNNNNKKSMSNSVTHYNSCGRCESEHSSVDPSLSAVFKANKARNFQSTSFRIIAQTPERILDAADLIDDFYLNLIDWSSASDVLAVALQSVVYLWDATTGNITPLPTNKVPQPPSPSINNNNNNLPGESSSDRLVCGLQWASDGTSLAIGLQDGTVEIWNVPTQQVIHSWRQHTGRVGALSWMGNFQNNNNSNSVNNSYYSVQRDGCLLASGSKDSTIHIHDLRDAASRHKPNVGILRSHEQEVCGLKWSPANVYLASGGNDNQLLIWDKRRFSCNERLSTLTPFIGHHHHHHQQYNNNNETSYTNNNNKSEAYSSCWESSTTPVWYLNEHKAAVKALAWNPTCPSLLVSGGGTEDKMLRFWNTHHGQCIRSANTHSQVCGVLWNQSGSELVSSHGYSLNQLIIWKYPSLRQVAQLHGHTSRVLHLCLSKDGQTVVSAAGDETIRFWRCFPPQPTNTTTCSNLISPYTSISTEPTMLAKETRRMSSIGKEYLENLHDTHLPSHSSSSLFAHHTIDIRGHVAHHPITVHHPRIDSSSNNNNNNNDNNDDPISPSPFMFSRDRVRYLSSVRHHSHHNRHAGQISESPYKATPDERKECTSKSPEVLLLSSSSSSSELEEQFSDGSLPLLSIPGLDKQSTITTKQERVKVDTNTERSKINLSRPPPLSLELERACVENDHSDNDNAASLFVNTPPRGAALASSPSSMAAVSKAAEIICDELMCEQIALR